MKDNTEILLFKDEEDQTSNLVIDYLLHKKKQLLIVNDDIFHLGDLEISKDVNDFILFNQSITLVYSRISSYWIRRGSFTLSNHECANNLKSSYLLSEKHAVHDLILSLIYSKPGLGNYSENETDKIFNLYLAHKVGLKISKTKVSSFTENLKKQLKNKTFCTKAIKSGYYLSETTIFSGTTHLVNIEDINNITKNITWPSLLQEYQEKRYELRIFYLDGDFYTSAIFSQNDEQTKVDFRNYNNARPNRTPPYQLPTEIEEKLHKLMQKLTIKCGSIDMVVNTKNEFIFLEVNPFGQFQQVSYPCNYYLELQVANYLTKYD
jgi:ATP-GRASP peptide maturase of grasp-with-spasm system